MVSRLLELLQNASSPFKGFLGELWTIWAKDAARAVLLARCPGRTFQRTSFVKLRRCSSKHKPLKLRAKSTSKSTGNSGHGESSLALRPDHPSDLV